MSAGRHFLSRNDLVKDAPWTRNSGFQPDQSRSLPGCTGPHQMVLRCGQDARATSQAGSLTYVPAASSTAFIRLRSLACAILLTLASLPNLLATPTPLPPPSHSAPVFKEKPFGPKPPPLPTQPEKPIARVRKPIPLPWIIAGIVLCLAAVSIVLLRSARAWRSSNLFDRQYRFPLPDQVEQRFGGRKCGGYMATVSFGPIGPRPDVDSKTKDA